MDVFKLCLLSILLITGCIERVDLEFPDYKQKLVIDGEISNEPPPYFFRVSKTNRVGSDYFEGVDDVLLIISDNEGCIDTLKRIEKELFKYPNDNKTWCTYYYINDQFEKVELAGSICKDEWPITVLDGYFVSEKIVGKPGNTYTLEVIYENEKYQATEKMLPTPQLTSASIRYVEHEKEGSQLAPFVDFTNPKDQDYFYMFLFKRFSFENILKPVDRTWPFSIVDGESLPEKVTDFKINDGESIRGYPDNMWYPITERDTCTLRIGAISETCYHYLYGQIEQLRFDGGAYRPQPTSFNNNFKNEVLGYFRVISVGKIVTYYQQEND